MSELHVLSAQTSSLLALLAQIGASPYVKDFPLGSVLDKLEGDDRVAAQLLLGLEPDGTVTETARDIVKGMRDWAAAIAREEVLWNAYPRGVHGDRPDRKPTISAEVWDSVMRNFGVTER